MVVTDVYQARFVFCFEDKSNGFADASRKLKIRFESTADSSLLPRDFHKGRKILLSRNRRELFYLAFRIAESYKHVYFLISTLIRNPCLHSG